MECADEVMIYQSSLTGCLNPFEFFVLNLTLSDTPTLYTYIE